MVPAGPSNGYSVLRGESAIKEEWVRGASYPVASLPSGTCPINRPPAVATELMPFDIQPFGSGLPAYATSG